jgi:hypothetical protein
MISTPEFKPSDFEYSFVFRDEGVRAVLDRFSESRGEIQTELTIDRLDDSGRPRLRLYGPAKFNLLGVQVTQARELNEALDIDWKGLLLTVRSQSVRQYREGSPLIDLATVDITDESPRFLLAPFIDQHGITVLVGDGGTGKSLTALAMALALVTDEPVFGERPQAVGSVVYLDWEADEETHAERLWAICRGLSVSVPGGGIHYQKMLSSLPEAVASLRKKIMDVGASLVIVDSVGMARGGAPESAEETIKLFRAMRSLGVPILAIDHISKESKKSDAGGSDPIGSVYTRNSARLVWSMEGKQFEGRGDTVIVFRNSKANFGRKERQRAFRYGFLEGPGGRLASVTFDPVDWRDTEEFADKLPVKDRIVRALRASPLSRSEIAAAVDITVDAARARLSELRRDGKVFDLGNDRWTLPADRDDEP